MKDNVDKEYTLRAAGLRALRVFTLIAGVGLAGIGLFILTSEDAPVAQVVKREIKPIPVQAPNRPSDYPEELPTIDNISLVSVAPEPGLIVVRLATPATPAQSVTAVHNAFISDGWELMVVKGDSILSGGATRKDVVVGLLVSPDPAKDTPTGWTTIVIYLAKEPDKVVRVVPQPLQSGGPKG